MGSRAKTTSGPTNLIWSALTAGGTTTTLATVIAVFAAVSVFVPQGVSRGDLIQAFGTDWASFFVSTGLDHIASHSFLWAAILALLLNLTAMAIERYYDARRIGEPWWYLSGRSAVTTAEQSLERRVDRATASEALRRAGAATVASISPRRITASSAPVMPAVLFLIAGTILVGGSLFEARREVVGRLRLLAGRPTGNQLSYRIGLGRSEVPAYFDPSFRCARPSTTPPHEVVCEAGPLRGQTKQVRIAFNQPALYDGAVVALRRIERLPLGRTALLEVRVKGDPTPHYISAVPQKSFKIGGRTWFVADLRSRGRNGLGPTLTVVPAAKDGTFQRSNLLSIYEGRPATWSKNETGLTFRWLPEMRLHFSVANSPVRPALWVGLGCCALALFLLALLPICSAEVLTDDEATRPCVRALGRRRVAHP
ncbi:MAG: hypothetical protein KC609_11970, partial [Myxococcales bacterium]|nr:hypothetical protein [Myxococcales bacterium]